jgi:hypothetical protein
MLTTASLDTLHGLVDRCKAGKLVYADVKQEAKRLGLTLAEYGDGADYSDADAYCYWNESGNRRDEQTLYVEYNFDDLDKNGRAVCAGTVRFVSGTVWS